jgi:poly(3-hydroxybutyrate) depolymerase
MIYHNFQAFSDVARPVRAIAELAAVALAQPVPGVSRHAFLRAAAAVCELIARAGLSRRRPAFGIHTVTIDGRKAAVREAAVHQTPFCTLLRLEKEPAGPQPRVLLVAPMSGPFATLLRSTAQVLLADHDVYITDWYNARDIGLQHGPFDFDDFIDHVITFLQVLGRVPMLLGCASLASRCSQPWQ